MKTVSAMTMRRHFGAMLDQVRGTSERVVIERAGRPVAVLGPLPEAEAEPGDRVRREAALARLAGLSKPTARRRDADRWVRREREAWGARER